MNNKGRGSRVITQAIFNRIRKEAKSGIDRAAIAEELGIGPDSVKNVINSKGWSDWQAKLAKKRQEYHNRAKAAREEQITFDTAINPEPQKEERIVDFGPGGLPDIISDRIHALQSFPAAVEIISKAVILCPESIGTIVNALYFPLFGEKVN